MAKEYPKLPLMCNMSIVKKSNSWTMDEAHNKEVDISRLKYDVNFEATFEGLPNNSKTYFMNMFRCFDYHQMQYQK